MHLPLKCLTKLNDKFIYMHFACRNASCQGFCSPFLGGERDGTILPQNDTHFTCDEKCHVYCTPIVYSMNVSNHQNAPGLCSSTFVQVKCTCHLMLSVRRRGGEYETRRIHWTGTALCTSALPWRR